MPHRASPSWLRRSARLLLLGMLVQAGCKRASSPATEPSYGTQPPQASMGREYVFGVLPSQNPARLFEDYQPLVEFINGKAQNFALRLEASLNYKTFEEKLAHRQFHFALANSYETVQAEGYGYHIFGKMGDDNKVKGVIVVRKDSGVKQFSDLKGAAISFPAPTSVAGCMMPKLFLKEHGLDVERECQPRYVGSQESSIMNVYRGETKAGACRLPQWETFAQERPDAASELVVKWETDTLINNGLLVRDDVPEADLRSVAETLFHLQEEIAGRTLLARLNVSKFEPATSATYEPARNFLKEYEAAFPLPAGKETP